MIRFILLNNLIKCHEFEATTKQQEPPFEYIYYCDYYCPFPISRIISVIIKDTLGRSETVTLLDNAIRLEVIKNHDEISTIKARVFYI